jgi:hypothetical protein
LILANSIYEMSILNGYAALRRKRAHMNSTDDREPLRKVQINRFMFAMFDVLGFSRRLESVGLQAVLDAYHLLIEHVARR